MVYFAARKKELKMLFIVFLSLAILFSPLMQSITYAADSETPGQKEEQTEPVNESTEPIVEENNEEPAEQALDIPDQDPLAPQNFRVVSVGERSFEFDWDPDPNNPLIDIWHADTDGWLAYTEPDQRVVTGLTPDTTYKVYATWYVRPGGDRTHKSNVITFTTKPDTSEYQVPPVGAPLGLKTLDVTESSITLGWTTHPNADNYQYWVNGDWIGRGDPSKTFLKHTLTPEQAVAGKQIEFLVDAFKENETPKPATERKKYTFIWGELAPPKDVQVVTATRSSVSLAWAPTPAATGYEIYQDDKLIGTSDDNRFVIEELEEGQSYSYSIVAVNNLWRSERSESISAVPGSNYTNVTYYTSWARSPEGRKLKPDDIDFSQFTHINYAFSELCWKKSGTRGECTNPDVPLQAGYVHDGEMILGDPPTRNATTGALSPGFDFLNFEEFKPIKENNPNLKMLISVGGWTMSKYFSVMAADEVTRQTFADSVVKFIRAYGFEGLDIDWEYPVEGGEESNTRSPKDKETFPLLMKTVREALDAAGREDGKYYLLTIASLQSKNFIDNADLSNSVKYMDFVNIMTYDFSGSWSNLAHHNSPLYYDTKHPSTSVNTPRNNVRGAAVDHLDGGVPNHKLVIGIPFYGTGWLGCPEPGEYQLCAPVKEGGIPQGTWDNGKFDFYDIQDTYLKDEKFEHSWNPASKVSSLYGKEKGMFISYNDETSMMYTASLVKTLDVAGVMTWDISSDKNNTLNPQLVKDLPFNGVVNEDALKTPQNVKIVSVNKEDISIAWDEVDGATSYEVFVNNIYYGITDEAETKATIRGLVAGTKYAFNVYAIKHVDGKIAEVSPGSKKIEARTSTPSTPSPGSGTETSTNRTELVFSVNNIDGKWILNVDENPSVLNITEANATAFKITVGDDAKSIEVELPQNVVAALAAKDAKAQLSIIWNGVTYVIPAHALPLGVNLQISIAPASTSAKEAAEKLANDSGLKLLAQPLDFKISKYNSDGKLEEITDFGKHSLSRIFTLAAADVNTANATGVVYDPTTNTFRPVPTLFTKLANDKVAAELKRSGNSIYTIVQSSITYKDATAAWAKDAIARAAAKLLLAGESADTFGVDSSITRAEFTSMIVKGLGILPENGTAPFEDVTADSKYAGDIAAAKKHGLIQGKSETTFDPDSTISRQDIAVILTNVLSYLGVKTDADASKLNAFADAKDIAAYAKPAVALAVQEGIMIGKSSTTFDPKADLTRAQAAVIVIRILEAHKLDKV